jgi:hypothetical protein
MGSAAMAAVPPLFAAPVAACLVLFLLLRPLPWLLLPQKWYQCNHLIFGTASVMVYNVTNKIFLMHQER